MPLTKFQNDGVENLYRRLFQDNNQSDKKPKALLADEVGMGKTVTAAGLIAKLASESKKPIRIGYICNNLALINENIEKLKKHIQNNSSELSINTPENKRFSISLFNYSLNKDRNSNNSGSNILIYGLSPSTSIEMATTGIIEERSYLLSLTDLTKKRSISETEKRSISETEKRSISEEEINKDPFLQVIKGNAQNCDTLNKHLRNCPESEEFSEKLIKEIKNSPEFNNIIIKCIGKCIGKCVLGSLNENDIKNKYNEIKKDDLLYIYFYLYKLLDDENSNKIFQSIKVRSEETIPALKEEIEKELKELKLIGDNKTIDVKNLIDGSLDKVKNKTSLLHYNSDDDNIKLFKEILLVFKDSYNPLNKNNNSDIDKYVFFYLDGRKNAEMVLKTLFLFSWAYLNKEIRNSFHKDFNDIKDGLAVKTILVNELLRELSGDGNYDQSITINYGDLSTAYKAACASYIKLMRKCFIKIGFENSDFDFIIADEIQNYSNIIQNCNAIERSQITDQGSSVPSNNISESNWVVSEIISGAKCPVLLMSATPFRYKTRQDQYADEYRDDKNGSDNESDVSFGGNRNLKEEFQMITKYLMPDKSKYDEWYDLWEKYEKLKTEKIENTDFSGYKYAIDKQTSQLKKANISRVERCMAVKNDTAHIFNTENILVTDDEDDSIYEILCEELFRRPVSGLTEIQDPEDYIFNNLDKYYYYYRWRDYVYVLKEKYAYECSYKYECIGRFHFDNLPDNYYDYCDDENGSGFKFTFDEDVFHHEPLNDTTFSLSYACQDYCRKLKGKQKAERYTKSTPAPYSFSDKYILQNLSDKKEYLTINRERFENFKPLFADGKEKDNNGGLIYNARIKKLFDVVFEKEELHKLLFIPPVNPECELKGVFEGKRGVSKRLFFSDYVMTTKSLSVLLSYEAERRNRKAWEEKLKETPFKLPVFPDANNKYFLKYENGFSFIDSEGKSVERSKIYDKLYNYKKKYSSSIFNYMTTDYAITVLMAYAFDGNNTSSFYDVIMTYCKWGCLEEVIKEYVNLGFPENKLDSSLQTIPNPVEFTVTGKDKKEKFKPSFAWGHYSGDRLNDEGAASTLNRKINRFNTPFWPFVFVTTSIGGEGFDFDKYCRKIVHWSLAYNPLVFEQREGRINRYNSYYIRLIISENKLLDDIQKNTNGIAPFFFISTEMIENNNIDIQHGLVREFYYYPYSFEAKELDNVLTSLGYYRALLGQQTDDTFEEKLKDFINKAKKEDEYFDVNKYFVTLYPDPPKNNDDPSASE